jgi:hypothetical protein
MSFKTTNLPDYADTVLFQKKEFYENNTNLLDVLGDYIEELNFNIDYEKGKSSGSAFESTLLLFKKLNDEDFIINDKEFDDVFKNYYIEKYNSLFSTIKQSLSSFLGETNIYFKNYSDDVGILTDSSCTLDNSITPYFDIFYNTTDMPNNLNSTIFNKVTTNNKILQLNFTKFNDGLLKNNLKGLVNYGDIAESKKSHGNNLVTDYEYYNRLFNYKEPIAQSISQILKGLGEYVFFIKNLNKRENDSKSSFFIFDYNVEGLEEKIDILKNKIINTDYTSNTILSS